MNTEKSHTGKGACCFRPGLVLAGFSFWSAGFLRTGLIILYAAIAFAINAQPGVAPAKGDDPQQAQFATRVAEMLRQVAVAGPAAPTPKAADRGQDAAIHQVINETGGDIRMHLRPGNQTVMQLRGRALASPAKGAAFWR